MCVCVCVCGFVFICASLSSLSFSIPVSVKNLRLPGIFAPLNCCILPFLDSGCSWVFHPDRDYDIGAENELYLGVMTLEQCQYTCEISAYCDAIEISVSDDDDGYCFHNYNYGGDLAIDVGWDAYVLECGNKWRANLLTLYPVLNSIWNAFSFLFFFFRVPVSERRFHEDKDFCLSKNKRSTVNHRQKK